MCARPAASEDGPGGARGSASGFQRGSLVRATLRNFLTYDDVTVRPGPKLNIIIGPNGTGKSTLVAGLVLGLGGSPDVLGRAKQLKSFIKDGRHEAFIELELFDEGVDGNHVISHAIRRDGQSRWKYRGEPVEKARVLDVVSSLNIQVDNLCQILPQEKVQEFVKLDSRGLLEGTEKAVGYPKMHEDHQRLIEADQMKMEITTKIKESENSIASLDGSIARLQKVVDVRLARETFEREAETLGKCKQWLGVKSASEEVDRLRLEKKDAEKVLLESEQSLAPCEDTCEKHGKEADNFKLELNTCLSKLEREKSKLRVLHQDEANSLNNVASLTRDHQQRVTEEDERLQRERRLGEKLQYFDGQLERLEEVGESLHGEIRKGKSEVLELSAREENHRESLKDKRREQEELTGRLNGLRRELDRVENVGQQRLERLRQRHADVHSAVLWLRENRETGRFQNEVLEPMILLLDVLDTRYAKYVHAAIPFRDLLAFTFENREDMHAFQREVVDKKRLRVSCVLSDPCGPSDWRQPRRSPQELRRLGFSHTVGDLFAAPEPVRRYLYRTHQLHNIPVADVDENAARAILDATRDQNLSKFMIGNNTYRIGRSVYSGEPWRVAQGLGQPDPLLTLAADRECQRALQGNIKEAEARLQALRGEVAAAEGAVSDVARQLEECRCRLKELTARRDRRKALETQRSLAQRDIEKCRREACDVQADAANTAQSVHAELDRLADLQTKRLVVSRSCQQLALRAQVARAQHDLAQRRHDEDKRLLREARAGLEEQKHAVKQARDRLHVGIQKAAGLRREFLDRIQLPDDDRLQGKLRKMFCGLPQSVREIEDKLNEKKARAELLRSDDDNSLQRYEQERAERDRVRKVLDDLKQDLESLESSVPDVWERWVNKLKAIVEEVNVHFGAFFKEINCSGEVTLREPDNGRAADFGICIRVQFRANEKGLCALSPMRHSGGERSVATMLYVMALQRLNAAHVPFRCVDEINQGMDAQNERSVFEMVVRSAARGSQYILVTPKLLPKLHYPESGVTVLCVFNSPTMLSGNKWDLRKFCDRKRREGTSSGAAHLQRPVASV